MIIITELIGNFFGYKNINQLTLDLLFALYIIIFVSKIYYLSSSFTNKLIILSKN